jgi:hypothetical protein
VRYKSAVESWLIVDHRLSFTGEDAQALRSKEGQLDYELDWFYGKHQWRVTAKDCGA